MRLTALDAVRYGALEGACLSGLSPGLTVVCGPNESGKTTMTALTRHVLYGYPDGRAKERGYLSAAGARTARLTFADESGEWVIARVEGKSRGPVTVTALRGPERPGLLGELVAGVSEQTYRIVFGFGIDELDEIEHGDDTDIVSRLYAAGTGLGVNPMDVRKQLVTSASELYSKGAQKPLVNACASQIREIKGRIAALEATAVQYAGDQQRLEELGEQLEPLREQRDTLDTRIASLEQNVTRLDTALTESERLSQELAENRRSAKDAQRALELIDVDERIVAAAPRITAVLADESGFRAHADASAAAESNAEESVRKAAALDVPARAVDNAENRAAVESWRDRLVTLRAKSQATEEAARQAEARARASSEVAVEIGPAPPAKASNRLALLLAGVLCAVGIAVAALGVLQQLLVGVALGGVALAAGIVALALALRHGAGSPQSGSAPLDADAARLKAEAKAARILADADTGTLAAQSAQWREWLAAHALDAQGDDPQAVRALLDVVSERQRFLADAEREAAAAKREREAAEAWVVRLVDIVRVYDAAAAQIPPLAEAGALAARARRDLDLTQEALKERAELQRDLANVQADGARLAERLKASSAVVVELADRHDMTGVDTDGLLPELTSRLDRARDERVQSREAFDVLSKEHSALAARLDVEGRENSMARARQELENARVQAEDAADRYLVSALAVRLIDRARERYERERQPEVVRAAGRVFSAMTRGRYTDLRVPLDGSGITVIAENNTVRTTAELSRGAAEQLYLALRIGLIGTLGQVGSSLPVLMDDVVVNFDPERRDGAITALAELAAMRQVIFFTCHPDVADALLERVPDAARVLLDRCELR